MLNDNSTALIMGGEKHERTTEEIHIKPMKKKTKASQGGGFTAALSFLLIF